ncbi:MAG: alpha/beta hydrolase [Pigmentiphaga sp.]|uniref:alpha/beta fold hydrolase n=1 Tax=Pigmentiphaga sp. TaxID=1977564 RepID=UPI0029A9F80D|nr:alpha/beta hydrolase [Pigmentiphaga sp.]MDX3907265.1 alpha/beta hydrolase [Pigmentiphaga sp.]
MERECRVLHYECLGSGPAVVLVAGLGGIGSFWRPVMERLQASFTVIAFDHPGTGRSVASGRPSIEQLVTAVVTLTGTLGFERYSVVGHSTGGLVAQALALDHAAAIDKIVLSCTWAEPDRRFRELFRLRQEVLAKGGMSAYKTLGNLLAYPAAEYEAYAPPSAGDAARDDDAANAVVAERIDMLLTYSRASELGRIAVPALVVGSDDDQIVPFHHSERLAAQVPGARLVRLSGGHFPPQTRADAYTAQLRAFLESS